MTQNWCYLLDQAYSTVSKLPKTSPTCRQNRHGLLKVENLKTTPHLTEECKLVIAEKTIQTFNTLIVYVQNKAALQEFARKYQGSSRSSLQKATKFC
jgi:hypothetical protein